MPILEDRYRKDGISQLMGSTGVGFPYCIHSLYLFGRPLTGPRDVQSASWQSASWRIRELSSYSQLPLPKKGAELPIFGPWLLWPNDWMHQDATWYGGRPQPRGLCVRWGPSPPANFSAHVYYSYCDFVRTLHDRYWFVQVQVLVFYAVLFSEKFNSTQSVPI